MKKHRPRHIHPDNSLLFLTARIYGGFSYLAPGATKIYLLEKADSVLEKYKIELNAWVVLDNHYHFLIKAAEGALVSPFVRELHGASARFVKKSLPPLVTKFGQVLAKDVTPWDKRQMGRLASEERQLRRELPARIATRSVAGGKFANTEGERTAVLAQFIARYESRFGAEVYRGLKSAITNGYLNDPEILVALVAEDAPVWYQYAGHVVRDEKDYYQHLNYTHQNPVKHGYVKNVSDYGFSSIHRFIEGKGKEWVIDCFRDYPIVDFAPEGIVD